MGESIHDLTSAMAAGDAGAAERFYRRWFEWLYGQARRTTRRDEAFCLDVVQDAVLRILRNVRPVETKQQWKAWMLLVVKTAAWDRLRAERRRTKREMMVAVGTDVCMEPCEAEGVERLAWLSSEIAAQDPRLAEMLEMRYRRGWTLGKIAEAMGLSVGTIDGRLKRALKEMRRRAKEVGDV